jgi:1,4-dihydroxy-2-naphthoate octaprenyltransferase
MVAGAAARPAGVRVLWESLRPRSLTVAAVSSVVGTAVLVPQRSVQPLVAVACLLLAVLLQAATNVLNDAEDALTGADDHPAAGSSLSIKRGWITPAQARVIAVALFAVAAALGLGIALGAHRPGLLWLGLVAVIVGWAYTAPPLRLAYRPLGEAASGLPMGLGIVWGTAAAQAATVPNSAWWAGSALALLIAGILHANNARDRAHDTTVGKHTLATRLSEGSVVTEYRILLGGVPLVLAAGLATRGLPLWDLLAIPPAALAVRSAWRARAGLDGLGWTHRLIECVQLQLLTGLALALGSLLSGIR